MSSPRSVSALTVCVLLVGAKSPSTVCVKKGNVYPTLTQQQLDQMRLRRLTSNCNPAQLLTKEPAAHQAKHIMMCRWAARNSRAEDTLLTAVIPEHVLSHHDD